MLRSHHFDTTQQDSHNVTV